MRGGSQISDFRFQISGGTDPISECTSSSYAVTSAPLLLTDASQVTQSSSCWTGPCTRSPAGLLGT